MTTVVWQPPEKAGQPRATAPKVERAQQTPAVFVVILTLACSAMSIFDLVLLAAGTH